MRDLDFKSQVIRVLILYVILDILVVSPLFTVFYYDGHTFFQNFQDIGNIVTHPFSIVAPTVFGNFGKFMTWSLVALIGTFVAFLYWKFMHSKNSEYEGKENGSSEWSRNGEEFRRNTDGEVCIKR